MTKSYYYSDRKMIYIQAKHKCNSGKLKTDNDAKVLFDGYIHNKFENSFTISWKALLNGKYENTVFDTRDTDNNNVIYNDLFYSMTNICIAAEALRDTTDNFTVYLPRNTVNPILIESQNGIAIVRGWTVTDNIQKRISSK